MKKFLKYSGIFIPENLPGSGHLSLSGSENSLSVVVEDESYSYERNLETILGKLDDGRLCSLHNCLYLGYTRNGGREDGTLKHQYYPNFAVVSGRYIEAEPRCIYAVRYHFEGLFNLFTGLEMFRNLIVSRDAVERVLEDEYRKRRAIADKNGRGDPEYNQVMGPSPSLAYNSGKFEICEMPISWGVVRLLNLTTSYSGSIRGVGFSNEVAVELEFEQPRRLTNVLEPLRTLHGLFELCLGQRQAYKWIQLGLEPLPTSRGAEQGLLDWADFYWSGCNDRQIGDEEAASVPEVLLDPERRLNEFCQVVSAWTNSADRLSEARNRFANGFYENYSVDRLVSAANMFDILPDDLCPPDSSLSKDLVAAIDECKRLIKSLPLSAERDSVLSNLGRVGRASLTKKVLHRSERIGAAAAEKLPSLDLPCVEAVKMRNHFVHGSEARFDYRHEFEIFAFLTDTLEFVFAVSDLIDLGWDCTHWVGERSTLTHPFKRYLFSYQDNLRRLKELLGSVDNGRQP